MKIERIILRQIRLPLVHFFETSFGRTTERKIILVEVLSDGVSGWGEVTSSEEPFYNDEWTDCSWLLLKDFAGPRVLAAGVNSPEEVYPLTAPIRGNRMAKGGLETAIWDLSARLEGMPLFRRIKGGPRQEVASGVSIGIQDSVEELLDKIAVEVAAGYQRIKIKIKPGWDVDVVRRVRGKFPNIKLMADANSAFTLADTDLLRRLDEFSLMMIEQPLAHDDILDHAKLQAKLETPVCLDESIVSERHVRQAIEIGACRVINIKLGRVGGFGGAIRVHSAAREANIPVWCGGMLEAGVGRAHNLAMSTLPNFVLPGDVSASKRYWHRDIIDPAVEVSPQGTIRVPDKPGFGFELDHDFIHSVTERVEEIV